MTKEQKQAWQETFLNDIKSAKSSKHKAIYELSVIVERTPLQERVLNKMLDAEYKIHLANINQQQIKEQADSIINKALDSLKKEKSKIEKKSRKERTHELIMLGTLFELTNFPKDRGLIAGVLLEALKKIEDVNYLNSIKAIGDELLSQKESKKQRIE